MYSMYSTYQTNNNVPGQQNKAAAMGGGGGGGMLWKWEKNNIKTKQIYTDWANHYLDKARTKKHIQDLQADVTDGVLLSDLVEAVTNQKVPDINRKPKSSSQMIENITSCLVFLAGIGVTVDGLHAKDIRDGNLKAILGLFFALSRHKQQQKQQHAERERAMKQQQYQISQGEMPKLATPLNKHGATSIPVPASSGSSAKRSSADKSKLASAALANSPSLQGSQLKPQSASSSRSTSPANGVQSFIPAPKSIGRTSLNEKHLPSRSLVNQQGTVVRTSLRAPGTTTSLVGPANVATTQSIPYAPSPGKNSVLDKFKFFNAKDKGDRGKSGSGVSKRTSSSSGFSSARSERSDSSTSLCSETKHTSLLDGTANITIVSSIPAEPSPKSSSKSLRTKLGKTGSSSSTKESKQQQQSPKSSRKEEKSHKKDVSKHAKEERNKASGEDKKGRADKLAYAPPLEVDSPVKQSKISSLIPKSERDKNRQSVGEQTPVDPPQPPPQEVNSPQHNNSHHQRSMSPPQVPPSPLANNSGIPKPTAAVKGTSKSGDKVVSANKVAKREETAASEAVIVDSNKMVMATRNASLPKQKSVPSASSSGSGISVAMVSPMPSVANLASLQVATSESGSNISESSHSNSNGPSNSNSSESSVIYKPGSESGSSDISKACKISDKARCGTPGTKLETTFDHTDKVITEETSHVRSRETAIGEEEDIIMNVKPMQPILYASPYGYLRGLGLPPQKAPPSVHMTRLSYHAENQTSSNKVNGGNRTLYSSPHDPYRFLHNMKVRNAVDGDYSDIESIDYATGYMSDGDVLKSGGCNGTVVRPGALSDSHDGYMSEGGASLYARRMQARFREAMQATKDGKPLITDDRTSESSLSPSEPVVLGLRGGSASYIEPPPPPPPHRFRPKGRGFDDSSSISSGISDAVGEISTDDNFTASSLHSDLSGHQYESVKRASTTSDGESLASCGSSSRREQPPLAYRVVGGRNPVRSKADSSQQTDNSNFKQISNTQWKKFVENGKAGLDAKSVVQQQELRRGKSDLEPVRNREKRNSAGASYANGGNGAPGGMPVAAGQSNASAAQATNALARKQQDRRALNATQADSRKRGMGVKDELNGKDCRDGRSRQPPPPQPVAGGGGNGGGPSRSNGDSRRMHAARGVPASFGYVKRPTSAGGSGQATPQVVGARGTPPHGSKSGAHRGDIDEEMRTAQVSGVPRVDAKGTEMRSDAVVNRSLDRVPRTKVKVSGGTQTTSDLLSHSMSDSEYPRSVMGVGVAVPYAPSPPSSSAHHSQQYKSYSLTAPNAAQLSQNVRERLMHGSQSLPKAATTGGAASVADYASLYGGYTSAGRDRSPRISKQPTDGSLSDTTYSNYSELHAAYNRSSPYAWIRNSPSYATSTASGQQGNLMEADSMESLNSSASSSLAAQLQHARANSLTHARLLMHQREMSASPSPRLNRSNSIRSTKSEKLYPSMLQRSDDTEGYYSAPLSLNNSAPVRDVPHSSQPTSPTPSQMSQGTPSRFAFSTPLSNSASNHGLCRMSMTPYTAGLLTKMSSKEDDVHGSSLSLVSTTSSLYSTQEEKQAHEIRKLRRELGEAQEKVQTLTSQLSTNAHVVAAFEQSLSNMTNRLQQLTSTAEKKDSELTDLRKTIDLLRKQSAEAGLISSANGDSMSNGCMPMNSSSPRRHTINTCRELSGGAFIGANGSNMSRQLSADSVSSINSLSSACSGNSHNSSPSQNILDSPSMGKKKKKGWLRSSFSKAFSRSKKNKNGSVSDVEDSHGLQSDVSAPSSPLLNTPHVMNGTSNNGVPAANGSAGQGMKVSHSSNAIYVKDPDNPEVVHDLKKQLREKDMVLTDIRLEALSSAHQLESLKETVCKMRSEMMNLKHDNERLQRLVTSKSLASSQSSLSMTDSLKRRQSTSECTAPTGIDVLLGDPNDKEGKRITLSVFLGPHGNYEKYVSSPEGGVPAECYIGCISVGAKTKWDLLDNLVKRIFKEYVFRIDPVSNLGLTVESVWSYHVGEVTRSKDSEMPELLPCGYLVGDVTHIRVCLKGAYHGGSVDALAFETLTPKSIVQRYVSLLTEHRRIILCGPSGTGKTYLATKLAEFLVQRTSKESTAEAIATFSVDHKSSKELRQYLSNLADQCENNAADLPLVIILDNLHHAGSLTEVFNGFLNAKYTKCPYIIGTMNQATCSTTNLQLHHNFRWVLCANHMEPVKGFLGRYLRRRLIETEAKAGTRQPELGRVLDWVPRVWIHLNKFLETHSSSDVTIGPRLFLSCPTDVDGSQVWFTDLWNYSIVPYLLEAVKEGLQLYGRRAAWEDPSAYLLDTYPWEDTSVHANQEALLRLRPEDVGYDIQGPTGIAGGSSKSVNSTQNDTDADPLLNMLMRLQEAANYSSPHSNDSDSASLDSRTSLHNDDLMNTGMESTL